MQYLNFSWADYTLFVVMFGLSAVVGIYYGCFGKKQETTSDYLLGGKQMKVFPVAVSLVASTLSGISLLAMPAEIYIYGTQFIIINCAIIVTGFIVYFVYLPVLWKSQTTAFQYFEMRFDSSVRTLASLLFTLSNCIYLPIVIYAPSLAFNQVTGFDLRIIAVVMSSICIFYTTIGGLKAVIWTDTLQFSITLCTLCCVLIMGTIQAGGLTEILEKAKLGERIEFFNMNPDPTLRTSFWSVFIGSIFSMTAFLGVSPTTTQRLLAVPTFKDSTKVLIIFVIFTAITKAMCCFSGLIMYAKYYKCDPLTAGYMKKADQIVPYYVLDVAAQIPGLSGLFVAGLFTTALSTLSMVLNSLAGIIYTDFVAPFMPDTTTEKRASSIMKYITAIIGIVSVALVFVVEQLGSILELMFSFNAINLGPLLGLFTLGMVFPCANKKGTLFGTLIALILMSFTVIKHQMHVWNGTIKHNTKPLFTYGCNTTSGNNSTETTMFTAHNATENAFWLFRVSFHYHILMGTLMTLIFGLAISRITWTTNDLYVNPDLLSPFVRRFVNKSNHVALVQKDILILQSGQESTFVDKTRTE